MEITWHSTSKSNELSHFERNKAATPIVNKGKSVDSLQFLGTHISQNLKYTTNINAVENKDYNAFCCTHQYNDDEIQPLHPEPSLSVSN